MIRSKSRCADCHISKSRWPGQRSLPRPFCMQTPSLAHGLAIFLHNAASPRLWRSVERGHRAVPALWGRPSAVSWGCAGRNLQLRFHTKRASPPRGRPFSRGLFALLRIALLNGRFKRRVCKGRLPRRQRGGLLLYAFAPLLAQRDQHHAHKDEQRAEKALQAHALVEQQK